MDISKYKPIYVENRINSIYKELPDEEQLNKVLCEKSLAFYTKQVWHIIENKKPYIWNWHLDAICDHLEAVTNGEINYLLINIPPRHTKLIADSQPILTPKGWRKHGELEIGDEVFGSDGKPTEIINKTKKNIADLEVVFGNGEIIKCNKDHLWTVFDRYSRKWVTRTTESLSIINKNKTDRCRFQLPYSPTCQFKKKKLILDPYFVGLWLGDGTASKSAITHDKFDFIPILKKLEKSGIKENIRFNNDKGFSEGSNSVRVEFNFQGILNKLRKIGIYKNKHIPKKYKFSSLEQRKQLLAGLIDSDGSCDSNGRIRIGTIYKRLANNIYDLVLSLGFNPYIMKGSGPNTEKTYYTIGFSPTIDLPILTERKKPKRKPVKRRIGIKEIRKAKNPEMGNCITVKNKDGLYLVGKKNVVTHNSLIAVVIWPTWIWGPKRQAQKRFVTSSYAASLSIRDCRKSRLIIQSDWYQKKWGRSFKLSDDQNAKGRYDNDKSGYRLATSVGGIGTGEGGDYIICDDPHNVQEAESELKRNDVLTWWDEAMSTRLDDEENGAYIIIAQRTHHNDLCGHIIDKADAGDIPNLTKLILPARYEKERELKLQTRTPLDFKDPRTEEGEILDKNRFSEKKMKSREMRMTEYSRAGQLQQRPSPRGGGMFKIANFKAIPTKPPWNLVLKAVRYWDKACLLEDTKITTNKGNKNIKDIQTGDFVLTRKGYRKVLKSWLSKYTNEICTVIFSNGKSITGTPDHLVYTKNREWVQLSKLKGTDILCQEREITNLRKYFFKGGDILERKEQDISIVMNGIRKLKDMIIDHCIEMFGNSILEVFPMVIISTTGTTTGITTTSEILGALKLSNIEGFMRKIYHLRLLWQIRNTEKKHLRLLELKTKKIKDIFVNFVEKYLVLKALKQYIVRMLNVSIKDGYIEGNKEEKKSEQVLNGYIPVYDLMIEGTPEFFANGILVHNSTEGGGCLSAGVLMYEMRTPEWTGPQFIVADVVYGQWSSSTRNLRMVQEAQNDGKEVYVYTEQEPGSGGKESAEITVRLLAGYKVFADKVTGSKEIRAENYAAQVEVNNVGYVVNVNWNKDFLSQHEHFPTGSGFKDIVDASSGAFNLLTLAKRKKAGTWGN